MKKSVFVFMVAAALVSSCSKSEVESVPTDGSLISLKSVAYTTGASTRAPFEGNIGASNALEALVPSSVISGSYVTDIWAKGTMTFNDLAIAAAYNTPLETGSVTFPVNPEPEQVYAFGLYPATGWELAATSADFAFTGKEDVLAAKEVLITKAGVDAADYEILEFNHLLTKLKVQLRGEANVVASARKIASVELVADAGGIGKLKDKVTFTAVDATVAWTDGATSLPFYKATKADGAITYTNNAYTNQEYALTVDATLQAYALVAPVDASKGNEEEYFLRVQRVGASDPDYVPFDLIAADKTQFTGSTAGHAFTVTVNYEEAGVIKALATVTDWIEEGESIAGVVVTP